LKKYKDEVVRLKEKIKSQNINMEEALAQLTVTNNETFSFKDRIFLKLLFFLIHRK
jgi:hypothetical protein